ncbi:hypothetical protein AAE478_000639 [Parahypoxylon ruwenzoriense]
MSVVYAGLTTSTADELAKRTNRIETDLVPPTAEGWKVIISGAVLVLLTALWTYMRLWSLGRSGRGFLIEDWLNLGAVVLFYGLVASDFVMVLAGGMGYHAGEVQDWHVVRLLKATYARQFLYAVSLGLIKLSVILMFIRVFFARRLRFAPVAVIIFTIAWVALALLVEVLVCRPISMNWDSRELAPGGRCGNQVAAFVSVGIVDVINQLLILMLPVPHVWRLGIKRHYQVATTCIFGIGVLSIAFGVVRIYMVLQIDFSDVPYTAAQTTIYGACETGIAIMVSSSAHLRPVFDRFLGRFFLSGGSVWADKNGEVILSPRSGGRSTKSSGFTQMKNESQEELELGSMGAHRAKRNTVITVGKQPSADLADDSSLYRIVVTSETIVSRDKGEL